MNARRLQLRIFLKCFSNFNQVIPCFDEDNILASLESIRSCEYPGFPIEVIIVINASESATESIKNKNIFTFKEGEKWAGKHNSLNKRFLFILKNDLPAKHAGVGLARKIGMDEAVFRLEQVGKNNGLIVCFDADSLCQGNYLVEIAETFQKDPQLEAAGIHFEHPVKGEGYNKDVYKAITNYEILICRSCSAQ